jgi:DNA-binding transcriptional regulator YhcF (GntR family)
MPLGSHPGGASGTLWHMQPITVDHDSPTPPYEQVREQIRARVDRGSLTPGTRLPTVRGLATELGLAANTIARAYRELEALGVIETRGRAGSVVTGAGTERAAREAAHEYVARLRALGVDQAEGLDLVRRAFG